MEWYYWIAIFTCISLAYLIYAIKTAPLYPEDYQEDDSYNFRKIWQLKQIKCGDNNIKLALDSTIPKDEIWFVDMDGDIQKFKMIQFP